MKMKFEYDKEKNSMTIFLYKSKDDVKNVEFAWTLNDGEVEALCLTTAVNSLLE